MYTGSLGEPAKGKEAELLAAADKYSLLELKKQCEKVCWSSCDLNQNLNFIPGVVSRGSCSHSVVTAGGGGQARCCGAEEHLRQGAPVRLLTSVKYQPFKGTSAP